MACPALPQLTLGGSDASPIVGEYGNHWGIALMPAPNAAVPSEICPLSREADNSGSRQQHHSG